MRKGFNIAVLAACFCFLFTSLAAAEYTQQECDKLYFSAQYDEAYQCIRSMASEGDPQSQFNLAVLYHLGQGVAKNKTKTIYWLTRAAENDHPSAQFGVGAAYEAGFGVDQSLVTAADWYEKAANQGHAAAQTNLGVMYGNGEGVESNDITALKWFRLAASKGSSKAKRNAELISKRMSKDQIIEADAMAAAWQPEQKGKMLSLPIP